MVAADSESGFNARLLLATTVTTHTKKMNQREIIETSLKVISLLFIVKAVEGTRDVLAYFGTYGARIGSIDELWIMVASSILVIITNIIFFFILAFKTGSIITILKIPIREDLKPINIGLKKIELIECGLIIIGIIVIVNSIPQIFYKIINSIYFERKPDSILSDNPKGDLTYSIVKLIIGFIVIYYSQNMSRLITKEK